MSTADPTKFKVAKTARIKGIALCIANVPGTRKLFLGSSDFKVYEVDLAAEKPLPVEFTGEGHQSYVTGAALAGSQLATGGYDGRLIWWDIEKREPVRSIAAHERWIRNVVASPDGKLVATVADSLAFSPDGKLLAAGGVGTIGNIDHLDGPSRIEIFDWNSKQRAHEISDTKFKGLVEQIAFARDGSWLVSAGGDNGGFVSFYDSQTGKVVHQDKMPMHVHKFVLNDTQDALYAAGHEQVAVVEFKSVPAAAEPAATTT